MVDSHEGTGFQALFNGILQIPGTGKRPKAESTRDSRDAWLLDAFLGKKTWWWPMALKKLWCEPAFKVEDLQTLPDSGYLHIYIYMSKFRTHPSSSQQFLVRVFHHSTSSHFPKGLCQLSLSHAFLAMALHPSFEGVQWPDPSSRKGCLISILLFLLVATIIASILIIIGSFSLNWCLLLLV